MKFKKVESMDELSKAIHNQEQQTYKTIIQEQIRKLQIPQMTLLQRVEGSPLFVRAYPKETGLQFSLIEVKRVLPFAEIIKTKTGIQTKIWNAELLSHLNVVPRITRQGRVVGTYHFYPESVPVLKRYTFAEEPFSPQALIRFVPDDRRVALCAQDSGAWEQMLSSFYEEQTVQDAIARYSIYLNNCINDKSLHLK